MIWLTLFFVTYFLAGAQSLISGLALLELMRQKHPDIPRWTFFDGVSYLLAWPLVLLMNLVSYATGFIAGYRKES